MKEDTVSILNEFTRKSPPLHRIKPNKCSTQENKSVAWTHTRASRSTPRLLAIYFVRINFHGFRVESSAYFCAPIVDFCFSKIIPKCGRNDQKSVLSIFLWIRIKAEIFADRQIQTTLFTLLSEKKIPLVT